MKAIIIGATGATGKVLVERLLITDWISEVVALVRIKSLKDHPKLKQILVNFNRLNDYSKYINGDITFSCMGTTIKQAGTKDAQWKIDHDFQCNFGKICKTNGVSNFVLLSSVNANTKSSFFYGKMKGMVEKDIEALNFNKLIIVKPSFLIRPNTDRTMEYIGVKCMLFFNKLGIGKNHTPLHVKTVANAMVKSIKSPIERITYINIEHIKTLNKA